MRHLTSIESHRLIEFLKHIQFLAEMTEQNDRASYYENEFIFDEESEAYSVSSSVLKHGWELWETEDESDS